MKTLRAVVLIGLGLLFASAGCPLFPGGGYNFGTTGGTGTGDGGGPAGGGGGGATGGGDALSDVFTGCEEPLQGAAWRAEVLRLVNQARADYGHAPLTWNGTLADQATQYACEMIYFDFFAHENPVTGSTLAERAASFNYDYAWIGENLAAGQATPAEAVAAWLDSPCHRKNLLHPAFTELGVGVRTGGTYSIYWVQEFGRPASAGPYTGPDFSVPGCAD